MADVELLDIENPETHAEALAAALRAALKLEETGAFGGHFLVVNMTTGEIGRVAPGDIVGSLPDGVVGIEPVDELPTEGNWENRIIFLTTDEKLYIFRGGEWVRLIPDVMAELPEGTVGIKLVEELPTSDNFEGRLVYLLPEERIYKYAGGEWKPLVDIGDVTFPSGFTGIQNVAALPASDNFDGRVVFLTTDKKLYRYVDPTGWTSAVSAVDIIGTIGNTQIADNAISTPKLSANAVTTAKIAAGAVTANEVAANAVTADKILAGAVSAAKLDASAVTADKIAANAVAAGKIAANAISAAEIQSNAVTSDKIVAGAITAAKIEVNAVTSEKIVSGAIVAGKIAANAVGANEIASNSITAGKIAAAAVNTANLAAGAVTANKISVTNLAAINITVDTIDIAGNAVTVPAWAETAGALSISGSGFNLVQNVAFSWGAAAVWVFCQFRCTTADDIELDIRNGGTSLMSSPVQLRAGADMIVPYFELFAAGVVSGSGTLGFWLKKSTSGSLSIRNRKIGLLAAKK